MTEEQLLSRSQLAAAAGVDEMALIFWLRHGLLESSTKGDRKHRRFTPREVRMAKLLGLLRDHGMNVGAMRIVVAKLREAFTFYDSVPYHPLVFDVLGQRLNEEWARENGEIPRADPRSGEDWDTARRAAERVPSEQVGVFYLADAFVSGADVLTIYRDENAALCLGLGVEAGLPAMSVIAIDLQKLFAGLPK